MFEQATQQFMQTLQETETSRDVEAIVDLFTDDAKLEGLGRATEHGKDGARRFWRDYLDAFSRVRSDFTHVKDSPSLAVLEWKSEGALPTGKSIEYKGVSVLEMRDGQVARFSTYYDSAAFLPEGAKQIADA